MDAVAQALADPIRRQILLLLRASKATAGALAACFKVSRPAVSRHLRVLREAGLVQDQPRGREREYNLQLGALAELQAYLCELHAAQDWQGRFDALATEVHRVKTRRRANPNQASRMAHRQHKETA